MIKKIKPEQDEYYINHNNDKCSKAYSEDTAPRYMKYVTY